jgi:hypothetical protein
MGVAEIGRHAQARLQAAMGREFRAVIESDCAARRLARCGPEGE